MAKKPIQLKNLLQKGRKRFGTPDAEDESYDLLGEREKLVHSRNTKAGSPKTIETPTTEPVTVAEAVVEIPPKIKKTPAASTKVNVLAKSSTEPTTKPSVISKPISVIDTIVGPIVMNNIKEEKVSSLTETKTNKYAGEIKGQPKDNQLDNNWTANRLPLDNQQTTIRQPIDIQTDNQLDNNMSVEDQVATLSGNEQRLMYFIYSECSRLGGLVTGRLPISTIASYLCCKTGTAKTTIYRLKLKNLIFNVSQHKGRSGWTQYGLSYDVYQAVGANSFFSTSDDKWTTKQVTKQTTNGPSSSSNFNNRKITTNSQLGNEPIFELLKEWEDINIPKSLSEIRFGKPHLIQIAKRGLLSCDDVQDSLDHFAYDYESGAVVAHTGPLNFLMGVLIKKGVPYISEKCMAQLRVERAENDKLIAEYRDLRKKQAEESLTEKFTEFKDSLNQDRINKLVPPNDLVKEGSVGQIMLLKDMFNKGEISE